MNLFIVDSGPRSIATLANLERLCETHMPGRYRICVVDLLKTPERSSIDQIVAVPTVVRRLPLPERRVIGTLGDARHAAAALEMEAVS